MGKRFHHGVGSNIVRLSSGSFYMGRLTCAQVIVEMLVRHGVDTLFTVPGEQIDPLFAALHKHRDAIRVIQTRHEQGAAYMSYGYARSTGRIGVYAVVSGPGFLNTTAALATGYAGSTPMLCLSGQIPRAMNGRGLGVLHAIPDQSAIMRSLTKWTARVEHVVDGARLVNEAFRQLQSGRPCPVALEVPMDVLSLSADVQCADPERLPSAPTPDPGAIKHAAELLNRARRPLIMVGGGAAEAGEDLLAVAELLQAPVVANTSGRGIISANHYLSFTAPAGHHLWADADVVLAVGTRLFQQQMEWGLDDDLKIVRIDIDPAELERIQSPTVPIVADARASLAALYNQLDPPSDRRGSRKNELTAIKDRFAVEFAEFGPHYEYLMTIRDELPEDGYFVDELTQVGYVAQFAFPVYHPRTYIPATYQGALGYGFAAALGVKIAHPEKAVVSVCGDGGFMYNVQELATAVLHKIGVVAVVFSDNAYGNVRRSQSVSFGSTLASDLYNPDFASLAETFGAAGVRATSAGELRREIRRAFARSGPTVIEVPVGEMPSPWSFIRLGRARPRQKDEPESRNV